MKIEDKEHIANTLLGTCISPVELAEKYFPDDPFVGDLKIHAIANDLGVWLCESCGWWVEESKLGNCKVDIRCIECDKS